MKFNFFQRTRTNPVSQVSPPPVPFITLPSPARLTPAGKQRKVLIIDDDEVVLKTTSLKLQSQGYAVATAMDGATAIGAVRDEEPDLVLLDLSFPPDVGCGGCGTWDGFQIMSWLRSFGGAAKIPFIVISGGEPAQYKERSLAAGAIGFFQKPIAHQDLLPAIEKALSQ